MRTFVAPHRYATTGSIVYSVTRITRAQSTTSSSTGQQQQQQGDTCDGGTSSSTAGGGSHEVPPPRPIRHGKESFMLEMEKAERAAAEAAKPKPNAMFLETLDTIKRQNETGAEGAPGKKKSFFSSERSAERKKNRQAAMETERKQLLVFRDVGMDLDKAILSRDILLIPKYFYYGAEYAIDNELERMLRYFNEHAINEMKMINDGKLMRGPERLAKSGFLFPQLENITKLTSLVPAGAAQDSTKVRPYGTAGTQSTFAGGAVKKPTLVIFSQLGQKVGGQADRMWRDIALSYASPSFMSAMYPKMTVPKPGDTKKLAGEEKSDTATAAAMSIVQTKPLDVLSLRSLDVQTYKWVHRLYVRRFLKSLVDNTYQVDTAPVTTTISARTIDKSASTNSSEFSSNGGGIIENAQARRAYNEWLLNTTTVGSGMLKPLFKDGIRNYLSPYAFLLDHKGQVRWMSAALPDDKERAALPKLFQQLGLEYFRDR
ncbi:phosphatidylinositol-specific phospholipase C, putative [Bodo saltans]|uniref:Phosphatidylinositol-specific phospholipase C, putative n=1 Tax=Bodo saltans TaxID=75058 RepID=A0A0S4J3R0_BODSA|nr:phosphatidylinositol-specific phospholipase C, putative [Bodo saltans]|eukprot:CUG85881.1 phosphatidylinositol-specific phospholipase C, putative [Bodo saltans]